MRQASATCRARARRDETDVLAVAALSVERQDVPRVHVEVRDERVPLVAVGVVFVPGLHQLEAGDVQLRELPLRRGFFTAETNSRYSASMERECVPDVSFPGCTTTASVSLSFAMHSVW